MRLLKKLFCRGKLTCWIIGVFSLFLIGNYFLLKSFNKNNRNNTHEEKGLTGRTDTLFVNGDDRTPREQIKEKEDDFIVFTINHDEQKKNIPASLTIDRNTPKTIANTAKNIDSKNDVNTNNSDEKKIVLLVLACNRVEVKRCLDKIFQYKPNEISVIVSQDCGHQQTASAISSYGDKLELIRQPNLGPVNDVPANMHQFMGYYKISRHYKWALSQVFKRKNVDSVIIVEDDIEISPDFFEYFLATRKLMDIDESIFCVSAWNDNGKEDSVDPSAIDILYRSDFFPGLGWMLTRKLWDEIGSKWPKGFWDDWMRAPAQRKDRACIRPEISRTKTFGRIGVSQGQFYDQYLKFIKLNTQRYPFLDYDLSYLTKANYDEHFLEIVYNTPEGNLHDVNQHNEKVAVRVTYRRNGEFENLARIFGLMTDLKAGVPRTAYKGIVTFYRNDKRVYIAPPRDWGGYREH